jgi:hypothetical protein
LDFVKCIEDIGSHVKYEAKSINVTASCEGNRSRCSSVLVLD